MTILIVLALLAAAGFVGSIQAVVRDGYRPLPSRTSTDRIRSV